MKDSQITLADTLSDSAKKLLEELLNLQENGVCVKYRGKKVEINNGFAKMIVSEKCCTFMRYYVFDAQGRVTELTFEEVKN